MFLLNLFDALTGDFILSGLFTLAERAPVFAYERRNLLTVQIEKCVFLAFNFAYFHGSVEFGFFGGAPARVVLFDFVGVFLIFVDLREQLFQIGQMHLGFDRKIENPLADGLIHRNAVDHNIVSFRAAMQFDFVGNCQVAFDAVIIVNHFLRSAGGQS